MGKTRYKGRFISEKTLQKNLKAVNVMKKGKLEKLKRNLTYDSGEATKPKDGTSYMKKGICEGSRIVDLRTLSENLQCEQCGELLHLKDTKKEIVNGVQVDLLVSCSSCNAVKQVYTGKSHVSHHTRRLTNDINTKLIFESVHAGIGCTALNKLLSCLNCPTIYASLYKKYEREVGPAVEAAAKESCQLAAESERQLVKDNIQKLCDELPEEIVREIYPQFSRITSHHNAGTSSCDASMDESNISQEFNSALGEIINIIVSYDMGWSKRGTGKSYDSLNGYGAIIGFLSGKILDYGTRNRKCRKCDQKHIANHDCRKNFKGSAKAMEADLGAELINNSKILKDKNLQVRVLVADEDSSTIAATRRGSSNSIIKLADYNHLQKHFVSDLYELKKRYKEMAKKNVISHLKKCFGYAVMQNKGKTVMLATALRNIPDHVYGRHENCGTWCCRNSDDKSQTILLKDLQLFDKLSEIFEKYASNAAKFSVAASSQSNESFNNIVAHKNPKKDCRSLSESSDYRVASAVCVKNIGDKYVSRVKEILEVSPGKHTSSFTVKQDTIRAKRAEKAKLPAIKARRALLKHDKDNARKNTEKKEGTQYEPNCGMRLDKKVSIAEEAIRIEEFDEVCLLESPDQCGIVYFDLETSGFSQSADILQIAAKGQGGSFSVYINPSQPITDSASIVTGLKNIHGELFLHEKKVDSIPIKKAIIDFKDFLNSLPLPSLLVAHNVTFDSRFLIRAILIHSAISEFKNLIVGFSDSLSIFRKKFPNRKGSNQYKLSTLFSDLLPENSNNADEFQRFHDATYDVEVLEKLASQFISRDELFSAAMSLKHKLFIMVQCKNAKVVEETLIPLKNVISSNMIKKIAHAGISYNKLRETYSQKGHSAVMNLLAKESSDGKVLVTKSNKVITTIVHFLQQQSSK